MLIIGAVSIALIVTIWSFANRGRTVDRKEPQVEKTDLKELLEIGEIERKKLIDDLKNDVGKSMNAPVISGIFLGIPASIYEGKIKEYEEAKGKFYPTLAMKEDSIGVFRDSALKTAAAGRNTSFWWIGSRCTVVQIVNESNLLVSWEDKYSIWVSDYDTKNLVDGMSLKLSGIFRYAGTKQYGTAISGMKTVYLIKKVVDE